MIILLRQEIEVHLLVSEKIHNVTLENSFLAFLSAIVGP